MGKFPIFRNGGIVKGQNDLDTDIIGTQAAQERARNQREREIAGQYFHSTPTLGNLARGAYHYYKSIPWLGGESESGLDLQTGEAPTPGKVNKAPKWNITKDFSSFVKSSTTEQIADRVRNQISHGNFKLAKDLIRQSIVGKKLPSQLEETLTKELGEASKARKEELYYLRKLLGPKSKWDELDEGAPVDTEYLYDFMRPENYGIHKWWQGGNIR